MGLVKINYKPHKVECNNQEKANLERHKTNIHVVHFHFLCKQSKRRGRRCRMLCLLLSKAYFHLEVRIEHTHTHTHIYIWGITDT
jgi:hypothetical protein